MFVVWTVCSFCLRHGLVQKYERVDGSQLNRNSVEENASIPGLNWVTSVPLTQTHRWIEYKESACGMRISNKKCVADLALRADSETSAHVLKNKCDVLNTT